MVTILEKHKMAEFILRGLWLKRSPMIITQSLAPIIGNSSQDQRADSTDRTFANMKNVVNQLHTPKDRDEPWMKAIAALRNQIKDLQLVLRSLARSPSPFHWNSMGRPHSSRRRRFQDQDICWFPYIFGSRARKCQSHCRYQQNQGNDATLLVRSIVVAYSTSGIARTSWSSLSTQKQQLVWYLTRKDPPLSPSCSDKQQTVPSLKRQIKCYKLLLC